MGRSLKNPPGDPLPEKVREALAHVSTATLTTVLFRRGLRNVFLQGPRRVAPGRNMVGFAYTLRYIPAREDLDVLESFADRNNLQRRGVEECPAGAVFVIDARGDATAASAGAILATRLQARGCAGVVTDGGFRDTPEIATLGMPTYQVRPSAPTNITRHHPIALNEPIACGGVAIYPGDTIVGDNEGVVCIPSHLTESVAVEAAEMTVFEDYVMERVKGGSSIYGLYPSTLQQTADEFEAWRKAKDR
ncbi:ribonuclease activity regulator RraA [Oricola thermophila]|uniref:Ribonuclease activity regulator RraA n=1 Tax=Oricola thermophila TaxID=2742145 RepID=A0A6N1V7Y1_9HYPH|nr:ribonuclease activity regulator RraA [Oricola thermophila]QKV17031.1 ribonuclease activity regulator RraA [Oricola thermophila]